MVLPNPLGLTCVVSEPKSSGEYGWIFWKGPLAGGFPLLNPLMNEGARRCFCWLLRRRRNQNIKATMPASPAIPPRAPPAIAPDQPLEGCVVADAVDDAAAELGLEVGDTAPAVTVEELLEDEAFELDETFELEEDEDELEDKDEEALDEL